MNHWKILGTVHLCFFPYPPRHPCPILNQPKVLDTDCTEDTETRSALIAIHSD